MIGRFRNALYNAIGNLDAESPQNVPGTAGSGSGSVVPTNGHIGDGGGSRGVKEGLKVKYAYQRPIFLQLFSDDEIQATSDHLVRPIIVPRDINILPWFAGYAEAINAGKSLRNEDQVILSI